MTDWRDINGAPSCEAVIVSNGANWTLARKSWINFQTLSFRWPFIKSGGEWAWVYANSRLRKIDFEPTHWTPGPNAPPRGNQQPEKP